MFPRPGCEFAILAVICTIAIFLFPVASGPYSAVHGPVTALRSLRLRIKLWLGMALAALSWLGCVLFGGFTELRMVRQRVLAPLLSLDRIAVLRC
jgi:hypothetical protein